MVKSSHLVYGILAIAIIGVIFISGCIQQPNQETVTCNSPYIKVGTSCCLDQNSNNICDEDETTKQETQITEPETCSKGYTEDYICSGNWTVRKYQKTDCSYEWILWDNCQFGCKDGICKEGTSEHSIYSSSEIEVMQYEGWETSKSLGHDQSDIISDRAKIGEELFIGGNIQVNLYKDDSHLFGFIEKEQINIFIYKNDLELHFESALTDKYGNFKTEKFIPRETGYYKVIFKYIAGTKGTSFSEDGTWIPIETTFYVSE